MIGSKYDFFEDKDCYKNSFVLKNKLNIQNQDDLDEAELEITKLKSTELIILTSFTVMDYKKLHKHLFSDIYDWAGTYRQVSISKNNNVFCVPEFIETQMNNLFLELENNDYLQNYDIKK